MAAKYKEYYKEMVTTHKDLFASFKEIHDNYIQDEDKWKSKFNEMGKTVVEIVRDYELRLTSGQEGGKYGKYASKLADAFWDEVRKTYPRIDFVGAR